MQVWQLCVFQDWFQGWSDLSILLHVDDMLLAGKCVYDINVKQMLNYEFDMKDLGQTRRILRMDIVINLENSILYLNQHNYTWESAN